MFNGFHQVPWEQWLLFTVVGLVGMLVGLVMATPVPQGLRVIEDATITTLSPEALQAFIDQSVTLDESGEGVVASRNGSVYHRPNCPGARQMSPKNKVWFSSVAEAEQEGYRPAKTCSF